MNLKRKLVFNYYFLIDFTGIKNFDDLQGKKLELKIFIVITFHKKLQIRISDIIVRGSNLLFLFGKKNNTLGY